MTVSKRFKRISKRTKTYRKLFLKRVRKQRKSFARLSKKIQKNVRRLPKLFSLKRFNDGLTVMVTGLILYIMGMPLLPQATYAVDQINNQAQGTVQKDPQAPVAPNPFPGQNAVVIPSLGLQEVIYEGADSGALAKGVWRRPHTSIPEQGGNTVLAGHRWTYRDRAVFYHLDKVKLDDIILVYWNDEVYRYQVHNIIEVKPDAVEIEYNTEEPMLTVYTCTPLWGNARRLVIQAAYQESMQ